MLLIMFVQHQLIEIKLVNKSIHVNLHATLHIFHCSIGFFEGINNSSCHLLCKKVSEVGKYFIIYVVFKRH